MYSSLLLGEVQHVPFKIISLASCINVMQESKQLKNSCLPGFIEKISFSTESFSCE